MTTVPTVQKFADLPSAPDNGTVYRILGGVDDSFIPYYVVFSNVGSNIWDEGRAPGLQNLLDPATMPHALIRQEDGTFLFAPFSWDERLVGDETTNPAPGFVNAHINKVLVYQNRLAFLYDESITLSEAGNFGNFFRKTVIDYIDSSPIDAAATTAQVSILRDALPFNDQVLLFSDQTQFSLTNGEDGLSATSLSIRPVTHYENTASPVAFNSEVYFAADRGGWSRLWEYTRNADSDATVAANVTAHVPRYIPEGVRGLISAADLSSCFVLTAGAPASIFVYQVYWVDGSTKAQSAWHRWDLPAGSEILGGQYLGGILYLVVKRDGRLYLQRLQLKDGVVTGINSMFPYLDDRALLEGVYDAEADTTTFTLPIPPEDTSRVLAVVDETSVTLPPETYEFPTATTLVVPGDRSGTPLMVGQRYAFRYRFSPPYLRRQDGTAVTGGRLQLRTLRVTYQNTAQFTVEVHPYGEGVTDPMVTRFAGLYGTGGSLDELPTATGEVAVQVPGNAEKAQVDILNDSPFGCSFQSAEWECFFWSRARP